ncbi:prospero homeobox protein 2 isoform X2 [Chionomys nivalis]|uniref:prospero homeobox protein 2 isoform X2 n=1 Tax=Chionomys nivalis TaxID=269649 RepID=UPI00259154FC|nr:prospero homeobox protein 2 isoform X2 [Chionomys nivalis]
MDVPPVLLSPQSQTCSHLAETCMEGERSPPTVELGRDSSFLSGQLPSSSLTDSDWFWNEHIQAKRARVETIVRGMCLSPSPLVSGSAPARERSCYPEKVRGRKRKQSLPMHQGPLKSGPVWDQASKKGGTRVKEQLHLLKQQLRHLQEHVLQVAEPRAPAQGPGGTEQRSPTRAKPRNSSLSSSRSMESKPQPSSNKDICGAVKPRMVEIQQQAEEAMLRPSGPRALVETLRKELSRAMSQAVDSVLQQFNRCITSQMIKWFSNFREFYYIQMEKYARQAISDGVTNPKMLVVLRDSEIFRVLNTHYNKGNDFEVPDCFLEIATLTLQEFFRAVSTGKDSDPSWKKPIYKIISKLDSDIPEILKSSNYAQELFRS